MILGMYVHQHWPYNHPYAARTWTLEDWRGYAGALKQLGYNAVMIWPMIETMPAPLTPSDQAYLERTARVIDMLHGEFGMSAWLTLCPNVAADDAQAARAPFEKRHFFYCDRRINPADRTAVLAMMERRRRILQPLANVDAIAIIDSDPGGYPGSTNAEFIALLAEHRRMLDSLRPGIELVYWMHAGWQAYGDFYRTGCFRLGTEDEHADMLEKLRTLNPEPWGIAAGDLGSASARVAKLGLAERLISFSYGRIEGEPSFPFTNFGDNSAFEGGKQAAARGVMGNAQTHCVQLPNTFAFARGAAGLPVRQDDYLKFADDLIPGQGPLIVAAWQALASADPLGMRSAAGKLDAVPDQKHIPGPLGGLLFGSPRRFLLDLAAQLRVKAAFETLRSCTGQSSREALREFVRAVKVWQGRHGYENAWWWPGLNEILRSLGSPSIDAVLDTQWAVDSAPPPGWSGSGYDFTHQFLSDTESYTPRLIAALEKACE
jgi:hypothetical protein